MLETHNQEAELKDRRRLGRQEQVHPSLVDLLRGNEPANFDESDRKRELEALSHDRSLGPLLWTMIGFWVVTAAVILAVF